MSALDALLGKVSQDGIDLELQGGLNFKLPLSVTVNPVTEVIDVEMTGEFPYDNTESGLVAETMQDAIDELAGLTAVGGGASGFRYTFDTSTTDSDPGAGKFRFDNATIGSVANIYVDLSTYAAGDISDWLATIDDAIGTTKGYLWFHSASQADTWGVFRVTARTAGAGYDKFALVYVDSGPGGLPETTAGDTSLTFDALGRLDSVSLTSQVTGTLPVANGGTGLTAVGTALYLLRTNSGATANEYASITDVLSYAGYQDSNAARTGALSDAWKVGAGTHASGFAYTLPQDSDVAFPTGAEVTIYGTQGAASFVQGTGATVNKSATLQLTSNGAYSVITARKIGANTWLAFGDLATV